MNHNIIKKLLSVSQAEMQGGHFTGHEDLLTKIRDKNHLLKSIYFLGIGGIGMSALAKYFHEKGVKVSGYDREKTELTREMELSGISIHYTEDISALPEQIDMVVFTPAIPPDHQELVYLKQKGHPLFKRSDVLRLITEQTFNICVAGTHGKTTITAMVAHILRSGGYGCNAFLGGISVNYQTNYWSHPNRVVVVEADEYDKSFLKLSPDIAVITAMDPDHLDIYGTVEAMEEAYIQFTGKIRDGGLLIHQFGLKRAKNFKASRILTYSLQNPSADVYADEIRMHNGKYKFDIVYKGNRWNGFVLQTGGMYNVENAVAAVSVAAELNIEEEKIKEAICSFQGVKRRFEYKICTREMVFIDDYAHHPEELKALIRGANTLFPGRKCTVVFQPHLFSRTKDLADAFAEALELAHEVILLPIYPAREQSVEGVTSELIAKKIKNTKKAVMTKDEFLTWIEHTYSKSINREFGEMLIMAGAGDIDKLADPVQKILMKAL
ncbi:MAG: UDP-N-acetylmuramate--L-alanine ligase [Chitinophagaceae bacterium]|nr:UDP-N-acetylmuramate--L-alanine ligase [Chitinophagaceae bacterium]